ncbi:MAG TPA: hypothetical protein PLJ21_10150 [Pseudobdellovibrionaceae bacterium]|jgi:hypothetical protein|nr:hypothetical protein [Pseudobdellovibrionaceae bacterium]
MKTNKYFFFKNSTKLAILSITLNSIVFSQNLSFAQEASVGTVNASKVEEKKPSYGGFGVKDDNYFIEFDSGNKIQLINLYQKINFKAPIKLNSNSCMPSSSIQCYFHTTLYLEKLVGIWETHPVNKGQYIFDKYSNNEAKRIKIFDRSNAISFLNGKILSSIGSTENQELDKQVAEDNYISCENNDFTWIPQNPLKILMSSNDFEFNNEELSELKYKSSSSVNGYSGNINNIRASVKDNKLYINPEKYVKIARGFESVLTIFKIPFLGYRTAWILPYKNRNVARDKFCEIEWTVDFSSVFNQLSSSFSEEEKIILDQINKNLIIVSAPGVEQIDSFLKEVEKNYSYVPEEMKKMKKYFKEEQFQ